MGEETGTGRRTWRFWAALVLVPVALAILVSLAAIGLLPIPGPVDEAVLLVAAGGLWGFYRDELAAAWAKAG